MYYMLICTLLNLAQKLKNNNSKVRDTIRDSVLPFAKTYFTYTSFFLNVH